MTNELSPERDETEQHLSPLGYRGDCPLCPSPIVDQHPNDDFFVNIDGKAIVVHTELCTRDTDLVAMRYQPLVCLAA